MIVIEKQVLQDQIYAVAVKHQDVVTMAKKTAKAFRSASTRGLDAYLSILQDEHEGLRANPPTEEANNDIGTFQAFIEDNEYRQLATEKKLKEGLSLFKVHEPELECNYFDQIDTDEMAATGHNDSDCGHSFILDGQS